MYFCIGEPRALNFISELVEYSSLSWSAPVFVNEVPDAYIPNQLVTYGRSLRGGEVGCTLAHRKVFRNIIDKQLNYAVVLENDAKAIRNLSELNRKLDVWFSNINMPVIVLLGLSRFKISDCFWFNLKYPERKSSFSAYGLRDLPYLTRCGTVAYAINLEAANLIQNAGVEWVMADDFEAFRRLGVKVLLSEQLFFIEDFERFESETGNEIGYLHSVRDRPLIEIAEFFKNRIHWFYQSYLKK